MNHVNLYITQIIADILTSLTDISGNKHRIILNYHLNECHKNNDVTSHIFIIYHHGACNTT